jgi:hypothetical protein
VKLDLNSKAKDLGSKISSGYHEFLDGFVKLMVDVLPLHEIFDHAINLKNRTNSPWGPIYTLSTVELKAQYQYLNEVLRIAKIYLSKLLVRVPIFFISKAYREGLYLYIDY